MTHDCNPYCDNPECIKAQRDMLRDWITWRHDDDTLLSALRGQINVTTLERTNTVRGKMRSIIARFGTQEFSVAHIVTALLQEHPQLQRVYTDEQLRNYTRKLLDSMRRQGRVMRTDMALWANCQQ